MLGAREQMTAKQMLQARPSKANRSIQGTVLVGIVTRNRASVLPMAIESALNQTYPRLKVAVLDDGSDDNTSRLRTAYPSVEWIRWDRSRGYLEARNYLMCHTDAEYYLSLDDDAWFTGNDEISLAVQHMENNPSVAAVAFDILDSEHRTQRAVSDPRPTHLFIGCGHMLRLSQGRAIGFYVAGPSFYGSEEMDLCIRLLDRNWEVHFLPGVHVWHDKTPVARDMAAQYRSTVCNDLAFAVRRCPFPLLLGTVLVKLLNHLRFSAGKHLLNPYFSGLYLFLSSAVNVWRSRAPVKTRTFFYFLRLTHQPR